MLFLLALALADQAEQPERRRWACYECSKCPQLTGNWQPFEKFNNFMNKVAKAIHGDKAKQVEATKQQVCNQGKNWPLGKSTGQKIANFFKGFGRRRRFMDAMENGKPRRRVKMNCDAKKVSSELLPCLCQQFYIAGSCENGSGCKAKKNCCKGAIEYRAKARDGFGRRHWKMMTNKYSKEVNHCKAQLALKKKYSVHANGPSCPAAKQIQTKQECLIAAHAHGMVLDRRSVHQGSWGHAPKGCHVGHPRDGWKYIYFNTRSGRTGRSNYKSICLTKARGPQRRITKKHCYHGRLSTRRYNTEAEAKNACGNNSNCGGVYDYGCKRNRFYLCRKGYSLKRSGSSCVWVY